MQVIPIVDDVLYTLFSYFSPQFIKENYFNLKDYKYILDYVISKYNIDHLYMELKIKIPGSYIIECRNKKQIVVIDSKEKYRNNEILYNYNYGVYGFHEGFTTYKRIRFLTEKQKEIKKSGKFWNLPQQFYQ